MQLMRFFSNPKSKLAELFETYNEAYISTHYVGTYNLPNDSINSITSNAKIHDYIVNIEDLILFCQKIPTLKAAMLHYYVGAYISEQTYSNSPIHAFINSCEALVLCCEKFPEIKKALLLFYMGGYENNCIYKNARIHSLLKNTDDFEFIIKKLPDTARGLAHYYPHLQGNSTITVAELELVKTTLFDNLTDSILIQSLALTKIFYDDGNSVDSLKNVIISIANFFTNYRARKALTIIDPFIQSLEKDSSNTNCQNIVAAILAMPGGTDNYSLKNALLTALIFNATNTLNALPPLVEAKLRVTTNFEIFVKYISNDNLPVLVNSETKSQHDIIFEL